MEENYQTRYEELRRKYIHLRKRHHALMRTPSWVIGRTITWPARKSRNGYRHLNWFLKYAFPTRRRTSHLATIFRSSKTNISYLIRLRRKLKRESPRKKLVGIFLNERLGDIVACEPIARWARKKFPDARILWCVSSTYRELIDSNPFVDEAMEVTCISECDLLARSHLFDEVIDCRIGRRTCHQCPPLFAVTPKHAITIDNYLNHPHLLSAYAKCAGLPDLGNVTPKIYISEKARRRVDRLELPSRYLVIHCVPAERCKRWPRHKWLELIRCIQKTHPIPIVEVGLRSQLKFQLASYRDLCGKLSLLETAEVIRRATLFVGVDSGPAHLANAVATPAVLCLGPYRCFKKYMPFSGNYSSREFATLVRAKKDLSALTVQEMMAAIEERLKPQPRIDLSRILPSPHGEAFP